MRCAVLWVAFGTLPAWSAACQSIPEADKSQARNPETVVDYMLSLIRRGEYGKAHFLLSAETRERLRPEAFSLALHSYPSLRRIILATRVGGLDAGGRIRLENPLLGLQPAFELRREFETIWTLHIGKAEWEALVDRGREFVFHQFDREGGYQVFPPDHKFAPLPRR